MGWAATLASTREPVLTVVTCAATALPLLLLRLPLWRQLHRPLRKPALPAVEPDAAALAVGWPEVRQRLAMAW